jgi:hypothetical protein
MVERGSSSSWKWTMISSRETRCESATNHPPRHCCRGSHTGKGIHEIRPGRKRYELPDLLISTRLPCVFYHRILRCFVLIDLKIDDVQHYDIGKINLYLAYFAAEDNVEGDNPPIGIILTRHRDELLVEYATYQMNSQRFVRFAFGKRGLSFAAPALRLSARPGRASDRSAVLGRKVSSPEWPSPRRGNPSTG